MRVLEFSPQRLTLEQVEALCRERERFIEHIWRGHAQAYQHDRFLRGIKFALVFTFCGAAILYFFGKLLV